MHTVIPNFVDTTRFHPASQAERAAARTTFGLAADAFVFGEVAAVKSHHKRIDRLIQAFAACCREHGNSPPLALVVAGAKTPESDELVAMAESLAPGQMLFFFDLERETMPEFYHALDVFVHAALFEMMPIALLEALACGIPVLHHEHPVMNWMVGAGGPAIDMADESVTARTLLALAADPLRLQAMRRAALDRAVNEFSTEAVVTRIIEYYREVVVSHNPSTPVDTRRHLSMPVENPMIENLRACLATWQPPGDTGEYALRMWQHALDYHAAAPECRRDGSGALPYLPAPPEQLGCRLTTADSILDAGCLGGYGLFDFAQSRRDADLPLPRMVGIDQDASSIELARALAKSWAGTDIDASFERTSADRLPFDDRQFKVVIARLLLPYAPIRDTLRELQRVLAGEGLLYLQVHAPRYYLESARRRWRSPLVAAYYLRPLTACAWLRCTGRQPVAKWFRETALTAAMMRRLAGQYDLYERWRGPDRRRPFGVYGYSQHP